MTRIGKYLTAHGGDVLPGRKTRSWDMQPQVSIRAALVEEPSSRCPVVDVSPGRLPLTGGAPLQTPLAPRTIVVTVPPTPTTASRHKWIWNL